MTVEELRNNVESTKEKLKALEEKAFTDDKGRYPIIKNQILINLGDIEFIEKHMDRNNDEEDMELYTELLEHINRTADLDLEKFVKENQLDTPVGEALVAFQMAAMDVEKGLTEEEKNVEIPPVESIIEKAEEENELDQVDTNAIVDSLDNEPVEEVEPIPQELVDEMLAQDEAAKETTEEVVTEEAPVEEVTEEVEEAIPVEDIAQPEEEQTIAVEQPEVVEATPEVEPVVTEAPVVEQPVEETVVAPEVQPEAPVQEIANVPTQDVNIDAIDNILNTLDAPAQEAPVAEQAVEETVATPVDVPPMEEAVATPEVTPVVEAPAQEAVAAPVDVPPMEEAVAAPEVAAPVVETPVAEEVIAAPEPAPAAPVVPDIQVAIPDVAGVAPVSEAPVMEAAPVAPEMVAPVMEAPVVEGPTLAKTM